MKLFSDLLLPNESSSYSIIDLPYEVIVNGFMTLPSKCKESIKSTNRIKSSTRLKGRHCFSKFISFLIGIGSSWGSEFGAEKGRI